MYGNPSRIELIGIAASVLALFAIIPWALFTSLFAPHQRTKTWRRVLADRLFRHVGDTLNTNQLQYLAGTTDGNCENWAKNNGVPVVTEDLGEGARLCWVGDKCTDRVILYFHGGAFVLPLQDSMISFWRHIQSELGKQNIKTGVAILNYSLIPTAHFPIPLNQAILAFLHLTQTLNVPPQSIQIVGDSAGGNLCLQLLSHIMHPIPDVPLVNLDSLPRSASSSTRIRGIYTMSPWVRLNSNSRSMAQYTSIDCVSDSALSSWGASVLSGIPASLAANHNAAAFLEPARAPDAWFSGADAIVDRILVSSGEVECLKDDIVEFVEGKLEKHLGDRVQLVVQKDGVHDDPYIDFATGEGQMGKVGELTGLVRDWLARGF